MNTMSAASMASAENRGMESGAVIRTEGLTKRFGKTEALTGVGLEVPAGAIYALVGANGAGKTTLIKLLMNILRPTAGSARVLGMDAQSLRGRALNRIGYVSENQEFPEWMTVEGMLAYLRPFYPTWDRALEGQLLQQFDLPAGRKLKQLSRGQRMKAAMASALAFRPSLLVLDEPFAGLDPLVRDELMEGLLDRAPETTIFLSSHDLAEIESFSSHVGFLEQGRLLFSEEMGVLSERFREVTVTLDGSRPVVGNVPPSWLQYEGDGFDGAVCRKRVPGRRDEGRGEGEVSWSAEHRDGADGAAGDFSRDCEGEARFAHSSQTRACMGHPTQRGGGEPDMRQALHIFAKDARHFWMEISISLVVTALFAWLYPNMWIPRINRGGGMNLQTLATIAMGLVLASWWILITRVVQEENLVGDQQWWITKPYEWPQLLGAKALFVLAFVAAPLICAQGAMVVEAGFRPWHYLPGMGFDLLLIAGVVVLPLLAMAAVTSSFGRMTLLAFGVLLALVAYIALMAFTRRRTDFRLRSRTTPRPC